MSIIILNMDLQNRAENILNIQKNAVNNLKITENMISAIEEIVKKQNKKNHIITTGMGKAGIIATKMSATLASIGIPSFYVNPAEAAHGDLGRILPEEIIIVFSHSGRTKEIQNMISNLHELNSHHNYVISIGSISQPEFSADLVINYGNINESCNVKKVPSTSTTLMLIIADIIAITAAESIGFNDEWFKLRHPGGEIGHSYRKNE
jgi:arabinose-5-phosphate isomerase